MIATGNVAARLSNRTTGPKNFASLCPGRFFHPRYAADGTRRKSPASRNPSGHPHRGPAATGPIPAFPRPHRPARSGALLRFLIVPFRTLPWPWCDFAPVFIVSHWSVSFVVYEVQEALSSSTAPGRGAGWRAAAETNVRVRQRSLDGFRSQLTLRGSATSHG